ncbi:MAG: HAMP domain-containing histidine kinase [Lewinellaceae bacterium]|nr:HAMP domain-containing histidine kinase [Saprospiraceae bacterium]MCB9342937.1 HAMP domain-containing histidine kinase [Lewinellaceae bacterium]
MRNTIIRRVIILGAIACLSILAVQTYWVRQTWDMQEREFNRKANQAMLDAANQLAQMNMFKLPPQKLVEQISSNYWVVNINNVFEADDLEFCLRKAFEAQSLKEDYEYGIFDCSSDQMVKGKYVKYSPGSNKMENLSEPLPKHPDSEFDYYFGVQFTEKSSNILSNMWVVNVFTVLMLITVAFFIYSMTIILRQKQLSELQRDFINNMTHEFKTPISTINISTDVFIQNESIKADARLSRYAGIIKEQVLRLNTQVEKVLQLAKIERDNMELNKEDIDLAQLIRNISPSLEMKINEKEGILHVDIEDENAVVLADRLHLTNILHNLVDNGVKYSTGKPEITISLDRDKHGYLVLAVKDNGIGISKENQKRVFDKFYRIPTGNVHNVKGFGLGLFYVKSMCKEHRWKLHLDSAPGKGTVVSITMPQTGA